MRLYILVLSGFLATMLSACSPPTAIGVDPALSPQERDRIQTDAPRPEIAPAEQLRRTTLSFTVNVPVAFMADWFGSVPLQDMVEATDAIPRVVETQLLTEAWAGAGARRRIILENGDTALEDILVDDLPRSFRYIAWNYTTDAARFVEYGVGEFSMAPTGDHQTRVTWTYAFKPRCLLGRVFIGRFVETTWSDWMQGAAQAMSEHAEEAYAEQVTP